MSQSFKVGENPTWGIMDLTARMKMNRSIDVRNDKSFVTDYTRIAA